MSQFCVFPASLRGTPCIVCRVPLRRDIRDGERYRRPCGKAAEIEREGLGDWTERMLAGVGVTKERYIEAKKLFDLAPTCDCDARKEWLNKVSSWWRGQ